MFPEKRNPLDFFKKKPDPKEMVRKWQSDMRSEQRRLERSIMNIQREEKVAQKQVHLQCIQHCNNTVLHLLHLSCVCGGAVLQSIRLCLQ